MKRVPITGANMDVTLTPQQSVRSIVRAIAGFKREDSGYIFNWQGRQLPW